MKLLLSHHPLRKTIGCQLRTHRLLAGLDDAAHAELAGLLSVHEGHRGEHLLEQGSRDLHQFLVCEGLLKRVVTSPQGREMTLRFAGEGDFETGYEAHSRYTGSGFTVVCAKRSLVVSMPMGDWCAFMERHPVVQARFQERLVQLGAEMVEHAVGLLLLDAPSRVHQFSSKHPDLADRLPHKDVASYLNLSAETFCRLTRPLRRSLQAAA